MSHEFKLKFQQMQENAHTSGQPAANRKTGIELYEQGNYAHNVCFVLLDGYAIDLSYPYLVAREYFPQPNRIVLTFTSHIVTLAGVLLDSLYNSFRLHLAKRVTCIDARYNATADDGETIVNEITIVKNG